MDKPIDFSLAKEMPQERRVACRDIMPVIDGKEVPACPVIPPIEMKDMIDGNFVFSRLFSPCLKEKCVMYRNGNCRLMTNPLAGII